MWYTREFMNEYDGECNDNNDDGWMMMDNNDDGWMMMDDDDNDGWW